MATLHHLVSNQCVQVRLEEEVLEATAAISSLKERLDAAESENVAMLVRIHLRFGRDPPDFVVRTKRVFPMTM